MIFSPYSVPVFKENKLNALLQWPFSAYGIAK